MIKLISVLLVSIFCVATSYGQNLKLIDNTSQKEVIGALMQINNTNFTSDQSGHIVHNIRGVHKITISHVNYETYYKTIDLDEKTSIYLTPRTVRLNEVIITGQFEAQSIDQTVFSAKTIDAVTIEQQGAVDLSDVLRNTLNITITPNKSAGTSEVNMLGLDGSYVKILIDGIPMVNINGNGNNSDVSQIDMSQIERVEIVEGPMAVNYGANASAGVINLITKKNTSDKLVGEAYIQEETVGSEYGKAEGKHIQNISAQYNFNEKWGISAKIRRSDFNGFWNIYKGFDHDLPDGKRGFDWNPKTQLNWNSTLSYNTDRLTVRYKYDRFRQQLDIPEKEVSENEHPQTGLKNPFADRDERYIDIRNVHNLSVSGKLGKRTNFNVNSAYSTLDRQALILTSYINTGVEQINQDTPSHYKSAMSRGTLTNFTPATSTIDYQVGYEVNYESIKAPNIRAGNIEGESSDVAKDISDLALYFNTEWKVNQYLMVRPGVRTFYNSLYASPLIYSINVKYKVPNIADIRLSAGRSYRTPNLTELFYYFVDANHDVQGNPNLTPEDGIGLSLDVKHTEQWGEIILKSNFKLFHNDIKDKITLGIANQEPLQFQYLNINRFKSKGISLNNQILYKELSAQAGISYIGYYNEINTNNDTTAPDEFLFSPEYNANISYNLKKPKITFAAFYKHTGIKERYIIEESEYVKARVESFDWLDTSATWRVRPAISLQLGVKNIFNNTDINGSLNSTGAHSDAPTTTGLSYGRSYFAKLAYTFK